MLSGVGIICFVASYAVALVFDLLRLVFRSNLCRIAVIGWLVAGLAAHTAYLVYRPLAHPDRFIGDEQSFFLVAAWGLVPICLYLSCRRKEIPFGLFFLPIILLLIGLGTQNAPAMPLSAPPTVAVAPLWRTLHVASFLLAFLFLAIAGIAGLMYIEQDRLLKGKRNPAVATPLPSLEWSGNVARDAIILAQYALIFGVSTGLALGLSMARTGLSNPLAVTDPLMLGGLALCVAVSVIVLSPLWHRLIGRRRAFVSLIFFLTLLLILFIAVISPRAHWKPPVAAPSAEQHTEAEP